MNEKMGYEEARIYLQSLRLMWSNTMNPKLTEALLLAEEALLSKITEQEGNNGQVRERNFKQDG